MTRLITDGAEMGDSLYWDFVSSTDVSVQLVSTYGGSGIYVYQVAWGSYMYKNISPISECYWRCRYRGDPVTKNDGAETHLFHAISGGADIMNIEPNKSNQLGFAVGGTIVATASPVLTAGQWYLLECYYKMHDTSGSCVLKIDGIEYINYTGDTKPGAASTFDRIQFSGANSYMGAPYFRIDDLALNNTSGSIDNSWCGSARIEKLAVNANGDLNEWTPSAGNAWDCVKDIPPNGETDYIASRISGQRDMFNLAAFTDTNKTVRRIWIDGRAEDYAAMASKIKLGLKTSGSVFMGAEDTLPSVYKRVTSGEFLVVPTSGNAWTKTELDALQVVVEAI